MAIFRLRETSSSVRFYRALIGSGVLIAAPSSQNELAEKARTYAKNSGNR
jgi:hypothetical protein